MRIASVLLHALAANTSKPKMPAAAHTKVKVTTKMPMGIPVGAVRLPRRQAQNFRNLLSRVLQEPKLGFRGVDKVEGEDVITLHLPPIAAASLDDQCHPELGRFLEKHGGVYLPGVRRDCPTLQLNLGPSSSLGDADAEDTEADFRFVELFAGIGGFRLGLESPNVGGRCVLSNELNPDAASIYRQNFADSDSCLVVGDVLDICSDNLPDFDMLVGGFPCQPFSQRNRERKGLDDDRGQLYREMGRILIDKQPKCFIFENVTGLVTLEGGARSGRAKGERPTFTPGAVFERILETFRSCGYQVDWRVLNSRKWLPQMRERVYIVGTREDIAGPGRGCDNFNWEALLLNGLDDEDPSSVRGIMEPMESPYVVASELTASQLIAAHRTHRKKGTILEDSRIDPDRKAPTLISGYRAVTSFSTKFLFEQVDGTPSQRPRFLTPRECTRLMGFPEDFVVPPHDDSVAISQYYQAMGNAVCPPVISAIGTELMRCVR